jgi:sigma-B regulation protein RsbU (phosphoserine phosphatase)
MGGHSALRIFFGIHSGKRSTVLCWRWIRGVRLHAQVLPTLRNEVVGIMSGTVFVFIGLVACSFAAVRRQSGGRLFAWLGIWSAMYGALLLAESPGVVAALPHTGQASLPFLTMAIGYLLFPAASLAWLELCAGGMRLFLETVIGLGLGIGIAGIGFFVITGSSDKLIPYVNFVAAAALVVLVIILAVPRLSRKYLVLPHRAVMVVGTLVFAIEALYFNVARLLHYQTYRITGSLGLAALLFSFGYVAVQIALAGEWRLLSIERELVIAQEIQASILPSKSPEVKNLRVAAVYRPMTAVAGDFYDFLAVDKHRTGFLVADVTGHGVPAALIASMIKVATQSVVPCAQDPREVLSGLNRTLSAQLRAQLVSAAYLWIDTEKRKALYSAAGHPPLLHWREGKLQRIESNGLLLGVLPEAEYPLCEMVIQPGDRFLLYTDGVSEPENGSGEPFGEHKLEQVIRNNRLRTPSELLDHLLTEICEWQPASAEQKDDITLVAIDVLS